MWGICLDSGSIQYGLFQMVIQYEIDKEGEVAITLPKTVYRPDIKYIKKLPISFPKYIYGEQVFPYSHPGLIGEICSIRWHFKLNCCFYAIKSGGKIKSKRYFDNDLTLYSKKFSNSKGGETNLTAVAGGEKPVYLTAMSPGHASD